MKKVNKLFSKTKSMPLDTFLDKVLYNRDFGYYQKKNPFGEKGDFITAPNISNLFGEMITIWLVSFWEKLRKRASRTDGLAWSGKSRKPPFRSVHCQ